MRISDWSSDVCSSDLEVDDPAHLEPVRVDQVELLGDPRAREARELRRDRFLARGKEQAIVGTKAQFGGQRVHLVRPMILGDRPTPLAALARRIAQAGEIGRASGRERVCQYV